MGVENRWCIPFPRALAQIEMQTASSSIWTWITDSISYNDNPYPKCASYEDKKADDVFITANNSKIDIEILS